MQDEKPKKEEQALNLLFYIALFRKRSALNQKGRGKKGLTPRILKQLYADVWAQYEIVLIQAKKDELFLSKFCYSAENKLKGLINPKRGRPLRAIPKQGGIIHAGLDSLTIAKLCAKSEWKPKPHYKPESIKAFVKYVFSVKARKCVGLTEQKKIERKDDTEEDMADIAAVRIALQEKLQPKLSFSLGEKSIQKFTKLYARNRKTFNPI